MLLGYAAAEVTDAGVRHYQRLQFRRSQKSSYYFFVQDRTTWAEEGHEGRRGAGVHPDSNLGLFDSELSESGASNQGHDHSSTYSTAHLSVKLNLGVLSGTAGKL